MSPGTPYSQTVVFPCRIQITVSGSQKNALPSQQEPNVKPYEFTIGIHYCINYLLYRLTCVTCIKSLTTINIHLFIYFLFILSIKLPDKAVLRIRDIWLTDPDPSQNLQWLLGCKKIYFFIILSYNLPLLKFYFATNISVCSTLLWEKKDRIRIRTCD